MVVVTAAATGTGGAARLRVRLLLRSQPRLDLSVSALTLSFSSKSSPIFELVFESAFVSEDIALCICDICTRLLGDGTAIKLAEAEGRRVGLPFLQDLTLTSRLSIFLTLHWPIIEEADLV